MEFKGSADRIREELLAVVEDIEKLEERILYLEEENRRLRLENIRLEEESSKWEEKSKEGSLFSRLFSGKKKEEKEIPGMNPVAPMNLRLRLEEDFPQEKDPKERLIEDLTERNREDLPEAMLAYFQGGPEEEEVLFLLGEHLPRNDPFSLNVAVSFLEDDLLRSFLRKNSDTLPLMRNKAFDFPNQWKVVKQLYLMEEEEDFYRRQVQSFLRQMNESREYTALPTKEGEIFAELSLAVFEARREEELGPYVKMLKKEEGDFLKRYLAAFSNPQTVEEVVKDLENRSWYLREDNTNSGVKLKAYGEFRRALEEI